MKFDDHTIAAMFAQMDAGALSLEMRQQVSQDIRGFCEYSRRVGRIEGLHTGVMITLLLIGLQSIVLMVFDVVYGWFSVLVPIASSILLMAIYRGIRRQGSNDIYGTADE